MVVKYRVSLLCQRLIFTFSNLPLWLILSLYEILNRCYKLKLRLNREFYFFFSDITSDRTDCLNETTYIRYRRDKKVESTVQKWRREKSVSYDCKEAERSGVSEKNLRGNPFDFTVDDWDFFQLSSNPQVNGMCNKKNNNKLTSIRLYTWVNILSLR